MSRHTPLLEAHREAGAKLVDFAGWRLPLHYGSQKQEHLAVRARAGVFDVSHMGTIDVHGDDATAFLRYVLTNDVAKLEAGRGLYSCLCREDGGTLDDLIVHRLAEGGYRLVVNAATHDKDRSWFEEHRFGDVRFEETVDHAMLAVQGPDAVAIVDRVLDGLLETPVDTVSIERFGSRRFDDCFVSRTGYTGEDGVEIALPGARARELYAALIEAEVAPAGLGARDTLRLEAAMSLYGNELTEDHSPVSAGLGWTIDLTDEARAFIGREVLEDHKRFGSGWFRVGLVLRGRGVLRAGQRVQLVNEDIGMITSGTFSPTLERSIALARVNTTFKGTCDVLIRERPHVATVVPLPFVRHGLAHY